MDRFVDLQTLVAVGQTGSISQGCGTHFYNQVSGQSTSDALGEATQRTTHCTTISRGVANGSRATARELGWSGDDLSALARHCIARCEDEARPRPPHGEFGPYAHRFSERRYRAILKRTERTWSEWSNSSGRMRSPKGDYLFIGNLGASWEYRVGLFDHKEITWLPRSIFLKHCT
jgi:hypothetical protein